MVDKRKVRIRENEDNGGQEIIDSIEMRELLNCVRRRYRNKVFTDPVKFVSSLILQIEDGRLPKEMVDYYFFRPEIGVNVKDPETMFRYVRHVIEKYGNFREIYFRKISQRIENKELNPNTAKFWKGRIFEEMTLELIEEYYRSTTTRKLWDDVVVYPLFRLRRLPYIKGSSKRGKISDADKLADLMIIDTKNKDVIVAELKNYWVEYHGEYDYKREFSKLTLPLNLEMLKYISKKLPDLRVGYLYPEVESYKPEMIAYTVLCENWKGSIAHHFSLLGLKNLVENYSKYRVIRLWLHAGEFTGRLIEEMEKFERSNNIRILRVHSEKPFLYNEPDMVLLRRLLTSTLDVISDDPSGIKAMMFGTDGELITLERKDH